MIPVNIITEIEKKLSETTTVCKVLSSHPVGGGCINMAYRLVTNQGDLFVKYNSESRFPGMFEAEAQALAILGKQGVIDIPEVKLQGIAGSLAFLTLQYIHGGVEVKGFWRLFGKELAALHRVSHSAFGWETDNYIGSLRQYNKKSGNWADFFMTQRLEPLLKSAIDAGLLPVELRKYFDRLYSRMEEIVPKEQPSLLHGDLWSGNYIINESGKPCLIDPAVYYGHREMDISMTRLFGGFAEDFYEGYQEAFPMEKGWRERIDIHNLYPLLVHVNLFGTSYSGVVERTVKRF